MNITLSQLREVIRDETTALIFNAFTRTGWIELSELRTYLDADEFYKVMSSEVESIEWDSVPSSLCIYVYYQFSF